MLKLLFLDIDGVLNTHDFDEIANSNTIERDKVALLNQVLDRTGCHLVISSAWRYTILNGAQTLLGFEYMLRSHSIHCCGKVHGHTCSDEAIDGSLVREAQILNYLNVRTTFGQKFAVVDDLPLRLPKDVFVQTDAECGLTQSNVDRLIEILGEHDS